MKTVAILLVGAIGLYAIFQLFSGNRGLSALFTSPGQITPTGGSVPGVPIYSNVANASNNEGTMLNAATAVTTAADAFGPLENQLSSDSSDDSLDATSLVTGDDYSMDDSGD